MEVNEQITAANIVLPKGGGAIKGLGETFQPNSFSGTGDLSIPIYTSPARGLEPHLTLDYSSGSGNGPFGLGFTLSIPSISRKTDKGIPKYQDQDVFILAHTEELVPALGEKEGSWVRDEAKRVGETATWRVTRYRPRTEAAFARIEQWTNVADGDSHWQVHTGDNLTSVYGRNAHARIADPADPTRVFQWLLEETGDDKGNRIRYTYKAEDDQNRHQAIYEMGRAATANRYIQRIQYGNYFYQDEDGQQKEQFAFDLVFDYGEYDLENPENRPGLWAAREDPFSSYRAGFEIRTRRLCRNILLFHHFRGEFNNSPFLVRVTHFDYEQTAVAARLNAVTQIGYRKQPDGTYATKKTPSLTLGYTPFQPGQQSFKPLTVAEDHTIPGYLNGTHYQLVDLYGEGIPGFLQSNQAAARYWEPEGEGTYGRSQPPLAFPLEKDLADGAYTLVDVDGDGRLELVVTDPPRGGFYRVKPDKTWEPYQDFSQFPFDLANPRREMVDGNGDGLADILLFEDRDVKLYPSTRHRGYGPALRTPNENQVPAANNGFAGEILTFADMFGDGLSHRVRIRDGLVECWPHIGYGRFAAKVTLGNAPRFAQGLDGRRLFLVDADGSGTTDLVYVYHDRLELFINQSGNRFQAPVTIPLPQPYDNISQITFADVLGNGTSALILTSVAPAVSHTFYDFAGGTKPYLLTEIDNHLGATTRIQYRSSTKQYLADKKAGKPWLTRLPFPVQVVEKVENVDHLSGARWVSTHRYHDGYYDPEEREFRGFGFVERWDTEAFSADTGTGSPPAAAFAALEEALHVPPGYTKTWYHTGAYLQAGVISKQYEPAYYQADTAAHRLADSSFDPAINQTDAETWRQAYRALRGQVIREEVYGLDDRPDLVEHPYAVTETNAHVRLVQPRAGQPYAVFFVHGRETLTHHYERNPADPRVEHAFVLDVDAYGYVRQSCQVFYPRRPGTAAGNAPDPAQQIHREQTALRLVAQVAQFVHETTAFYRLGVPVQSQTFEIGGLPNPPGAYFTFARLKRVLDTALENQVRFDETLSPHSEQARLLAWTQTYYWNEAQTEALPWGQVAAKSLPHHTETAVLTPELVARVFGDKVTPALLSEPTGSGGGYRLRDGYWWSQGETTYYDDSQAGFYLLHRTEDPSGARQSLAYDPYRLAPVTAARSSRLEPISHETSAKIDYHLLQPWQLTDINGNISQACFDPLGFVIATTTFGTERGQAKGDADLSHYQARPEATLTAVLAAPQDYLQAASTFFFYDLFAWQNGRQPAGAVSVRRETRVSDLAPGEKSRLQIEISYSDGFGRVLESKLKADSGPAVVRENDTVVCDGHTDNRWLVSGRTVYNNKGAPVKQYQPYYTDTPDYEEQAAVDPCLPPPQVTHYDPLLRAIRVDNPKGFFAKVVFTPWMSQQFDENDTVLEAGAYQQQSAATPADESDALAKAALFANTPTATILDNMGRAFLAVQTQIAQVNGERRPVYLPTHSALDIQGNALRMADPRLGQLDPPLANMTVVYDMRQQPLSITSVDAGTRLTLNNAAGNPVHAWDSRGFHHTTIYDSWQRPVAHHVAGDDGRGLALNQTVERIVYGENLPPAEAQAANMRGQVWQQYDQAGLVAVDAYSLGGEPLTARRRLCQDYKNEVNWDDPARVVLAEEVFVTQAAYDALDRLIVHTTPDGSRTRRHYGQAGVLSRIEVTQADGAATTFIEDIQYHANGQRTQVTYGNGTVTRYHYEAETLRLQSLVTSRPAAGDRNPTLQHMRYTYDPVGNITRIRDHTHQTIFCNQQRVEPVRDYTYDALYQLIQATGVQHPGLQGNGFKQSAYLPFCPPHPNDGQQLQPYSQRYTYDDGGNLTRIQHHSPQSALAWSQEIEIAAHSNRGTPKDSTHTAFDANGNMNSLDHLQAIQWNYRDNIGRVDLILRDGGPADSDYYVYDGAGQRVRKVVERLVNGGHMIHIEETIYLDGLEIKRVKQQTAVATETVFERQDLHVMDGETRIAIANHWLTDRYQRETEHPGQRKVRYQLDDHLGSSAVEVDEQANLISYEVYFPYGGTALIAGRSQQEVKRKTYRYSGKERDDTTGLYYYGARYYAPWLGRWLSPDPAGTIDGLNLYGFVGGNPIIYRDFGGNGIVHFNQFVKINQNKGLTKKPTNWKQIDRPAWAGPVEIGQTKVRLSFAQSSRRTAPYAKQKIEYVDRPDYIKGIVLPISTFGRPSPPNVPGTDLVHSGYDKGHLAAVSLGMPDEPDQIVPQPYAHNEKANYHGANLGRPENLSWRAFEIFTQYLAKEIMEKNLTIKKTQKLLAAESFEVKEYYNKAKKKKYVFVSRYSSTGAKSTTKLNFDRPIDSSHTPWAAKPSFALHFELTTSYRNKYTNTPKAATVTLSHFNTTTNVSTALLTREFKWGNQLDSPVRSFQKKKYNLGKLA